MPLERGPRRIFADGPLPPASTAEQIPMVMPALRTPPRRWTEEEFYRARDAAPYGVRYELVDGEVLVTPAPHWTHEEVTVELTVLLHAYVRAHSLGKVFTSPVDVLLEPGLVLQPDVLVVPAGELLARADTVRRLLLAIEILSPSSARHDRVTKRPRYQRNRVPEYWIMDDRSQTVERWRPDDDRPELLADQLVWHPEGASEPFVLDLPRFFGEAVPDEREENK
jgi:Uma2 family endonuclease